MHIALCWLPEMIAIFFRWFSFFYHSYQKNHVEFQSFYCFQLCSTSFFLNQISYWKRKKWVNVVIRSVLVSPLVGRDSFVCVLIRIACFITHEIQIRIISLNSCFFLYFFFFIFFPPHQCRTSVQSVSRPLSIKYFVLKGKMFRVCFQLRTRAVHQTRRKFRRVKSNNKHQRVWRISVSGISTKPLTAGRKSISLSRVL